MNTDIAHELADIIEHVKKIQNDIKAINNIPQEKKTEIQEQLEKSITSMIESVATLMSCDLTRIARELKNA